MLGLADEHNDLVSAVSCGLAKHRKSETIDRKDIQLAYGELAWLLILLTCASELTFSRSIPGFSSDAIRLDQARSTKRAAQSTAAHAARMSKIKMINEAKTAWRKEKARGIAVS
jgi:transcription initiation factor TFIID subunit TAF12